MTNQRTKSHLNPWGDDNPEKLNRKSADLPGWKDQLKDLMNPTDQLKGLVSPTNFMDQILGRERSSEDHHQPGSVEAPHRRRETVLFSHTEIEGERQLVCETQKVLDQLKQQVTLLEKTEKSLSTELSNITVEQMPKKAAGIYFLRFLEWLLAEVQTLRIKAEEGKAWLSTFTQKQKKKMGYWQKYKKHGTTFGLSHERTLATQTG